jgi:hypothetical protein
MNRLLEDSTLWPPEAKSVALGQGFDPRVIRIFYDVQAPIRDPWDIREREIPLPTKRQKHRHAIPTMQLVGITGSCKTTLGRQLIGTYPEKFPSISNSRTTTCDIEIITELGEYSAVVTFLPREVVHQHIQECAISAVFKFIQTGNDDDLERKFLEHDDQRFRLKYILGDLRYEESNGPNCAPVLDAHDQQLIDQRRAAAVALQAFVGRLRMFSGEAKARAEQITGAQYGQLDAGEQLRFDEDVDEYLTKNEAFARLIEDVSDAVEERFRPIEDSGSLVRDDDDWPSHWTFTHESRSVFLRTINYFSGNHADRHGTLLTPLVDGIRVKGPFKAAWMTDVGRYVILDGEGLGHTPDSASVVPLRITKRYDLADAIILTDRSDSSMQAASAAVLRSLVSSGHESKLVVCFTKFDTTRDDDSRPKARDRENHLRNSLDSTIREIGAEFDQRAVRRIGNSLANRVFFLEDLNKGDDIPEYTRSQLVRLGDAVRAMARPAEPVTARPVYDLAFLAFAVQNAAREFHSRWRARLGFEVNPKYKPAPWQRIKALSRYSAMLDPSGYSDLVPVDDFASTLERHVSMFVQNPIRWDVEDVSAEETVEGVAAVKRQVHTLLSGLAVRRMIQEQADRWKSAYQRSGPGSTRPRARDIEALYNIAIPMPNETPEVQASAFLQLFRDLVRNAIESGHGQVLVEADAVPESARLSTQLISRAG